MTSANDRGAPRSARHSPGDLLAGRYRVRRVQSGGMGTVLLCLDERERVPVALKARGAGEAGESPERIERHRLRFEMEGALWVGLGSHPHVVQCHYVTLIRGVPMLCLEWVSDPARRETSLRALLSKGPLAPPHALRLAAEICQGLVHADSVYPGFVHRDLKPDNVLITHTGAAKVTDFGFALFGAALTDEVVGGTFEQTVGTPTTMAPEQWGTGLVDSRADVYALGCILFRTLTGRRPFEAEDRAGFRKAHRHGSIPTLGPAFPEALDLLVGRCLAKEPGDRPASPEALLAEITALLRELYAKELPPAPAARALAPAELLNRAVSHLALGRAGDALRALDSFDSAAAPASLHLARALALQSQDETGAALAAYADCIDREPDNARAHYNRANLYRDSGDVARAIEGYARAIECDPALAEAWNNRALLHLAKGDLAEATEGFTQAIDADGGPEARGNRAITLQRAGDPAGAAADLTVLAASGGASPAQLVTLGKLRIALDDARGAVEALTAALDAGAANPGEVRLDRAIAFATLRAVSAAADDFGVAIRLLPGDTRPLRARARLYYDEGVFAPALADIAATLSLEPDDVNGYYEMGLVLGADGQFQLALTFLDEAARRGHRLALAAIARFSAPRRSSRRVPLQPLGGIRR